MCQRLGWLLAFFVITASLLTGCSGAKETDQIAYVLAIGIDLSDIPDKVNVTYQIAVPRTLSGGGDSGGGGGSGKSAELITVSAHNLASARDLLNSITARTPNLSHTKIFIIGDKLARKGVGNIMGPIMRFREFRGSMNLIVVNNDTAANFMEKNKSPLESLVSRYYESMMLSHSETSYYLQSNLHNFYIRLKSKSVAPYATLVGINPNTGEWRPASSRAPLEKADEYLAGDIPRKQEPVSFVDFAGTAIFERDRMVGTLTTEETRMVSILQGTLERGFIVVQDPLDPAKAINVDARTGRKPKITVALVDGQARITADVLIEGEISSISSQFNYEGRELRPRLEEQVSMLLEQEINKMLAKTQSLGSDIVGFGFYARPLFATFDEYRQIDWPSLYRDAQIEVKVAVRLRRTGLLWRTTTDPSGK